MNPTSTRLVGGLPFTERVPGQWLYHSSHEGFPASVSLYITPSNYRLAMSGEFSTEELAAISAFVAEQTKGREDIRVALRERVT